MRRTFYFLTAGLVALPLALAAGACSGDSDSGETDAATLKDFQISLAQSTEPAGDLTFEIKNNGPSQHEFVVVKTDLDAAALPYDEKAAEVDEDSPKLQSVDEQEEIKPGSSAKLTVNLQPGHYVIFCNLPAHYSQGMRTNLTVAPATGG
jgi:uncharacterized cupredoxin-like copper-binding protein